MKTARLLLLALIPAAVAFGQTITSTSPLPGGLVGTPYSDTLTCTNCEPPTWQVASGTLPPGLGLNSSSGTISGTPTTSGVFNFQISLTVDIPTPTVKSFSITISTPSNSKVMITTTSFPPGSVRTAYNAPLTATGGTPPYTWSVPNQGLPPGLSINGSNISGTPTTPGTFQFTLVVQDSSNSTFANSASAAFSITINAAPLALASTSIPVGFVNQPYTTTLSATGGSGTYTWTLSGLTDGLTINATTGTISGTPTAAGQFTLNATVADSSGSSQVTKGFTLNVLTPLSITTTSLPNGSVGAVYPTQTLTATGGQAPYTWTAPANSLPPGLTLNTATGAISGTPTTAGAYPIRFLVTDSQTNFANATLTITIAAGITVTPTTLPGGTVGTAYSQTFTATGGQSPYTWSVATGTLPAGLTLNATTGVLSGTPTTPGTAAFTVQATDSTKATGQASLTLAIAGPVTVTTTALPDGTLGTAYSQTLTAAGGTAPYTWAVTTGTLPAGLTLASTTGIISGSPSTAATSAFTVTVTDATGAKATKALSIAIAVGLTVTPTTLPAAVVGTLYTQKLTAAGGKAPYTFALTTGALPAGFTFTASTGTITGTAAAAETGNFTITVTDASGRTVSVPLTLTAAVGPLGVTPLILTAIVGVPFTQALTVTGGIAPYTFSLGLGSLPTGFAFNTTTGTISGTAPAAESGFINVIVKDSSGAAGTNFALNLTANNPPAPTVTVTGAPATSGFSQQLPITVAISAAYPTDIAGSITLTFAPSTTPSAGVDDAMIQFSSGSRVINFTIPANTTKVTLSNATTIAVLTGTTAGTITLTTSLTAAGVALTAPAAQKIVNTSGVPFISNVTFQTGSGGVTVTVVGFSSTRDMVSGTFHFTAAQGFTYSNPDVTVQLAAAFTTWWSNTAQSNPFGTQFTLTIPFTTSNSNFDGVSVSVTLTNSKGTSNTVTNN